MVCVSSIRGIAGNAGQTNYATSKAGVIGIVEAYAPAGRQARRDDQRGRARLHRDADDGEGAARHPRGRPAHGRALAGRAACGRGRDDRLVRAPASRASTARTSASAARACWGRERDGRPRVESARESPAYARAAVPLVPGASLLPFVPGGGEEMPALELRLSGVRVDPVALAAYARVCGFTLRDELPATYLHVLRVPAAHGADDRRRVPVRCGGPGAPVESDRGSAAWAPARCSTSSCARRRIEPHPKGRTFAWSRRPAWTGSWSGRASRRCCAAAAAAATPLRSDGGGGRGPAVERSVAGGHKVTLIL